MSEIGEVIVEKDNSNNGGNFDAFDNPHEESTILHTKKFWIFSCLKENLLLNVGSMR